MVSFAAATKTHPQSCECFCCPFYFMGKGMATVKNVRRKVFHNSLFLFRRSDNIYLYFLLFGKLLTFFSFPFLEANVYTINWKSEEHTFFFTLHFLYCDFVCESFYMNKIILGLVFVPRLDFVSESRCNRRHEVVEPIKQRQKRQSRGLFLFVCDSFSNDRTRPETRRTS